MKVNDDIREGIRRAINVKYKNASQLAKAIYHASGPGASPSGEGRGYYIFSIFTMGRR